MQVLSFGQRMLQEIIDFRDILNLDVYTGFGSDPDSTFFGIWSRICLKQRDWARIRNPWVETSSCQR